MTMRTTRAAALLLQAAAAITTQTTTTTTTTTLRPLPASVVDANGRVRYFAFGSNLAKSKMGSRGKNSSALAYERRWPAVAHDQRLAFNMRGFPLSNRRWPASSRAPARSARCRPGVGNELQFDVVASMASS